MTDQTAMMELDENDYPEIRDAVAKICEGFPGQYWRDLEDQSVEGSYPTDFVQALTESGYLGALIPEEYGGAGLPIRAGAVILETIRCLCVEIQQILRFQGQIIPEPHCVLLGDNTALVHCITASIVPAAAGVRVGDPSSDGPQTPTWSNEGEESERVS